MRKRPLFYAKVAAYGAGVVFAWMHMPVPAVLALAFATWVAFRD